MTRGSDVLGQILLASVLLMAVPGLHAAGETHGNACSNSLDCGKDAPHCQVYLTDYGINRLVDADYNPTDVPETRGLCSECTEDCHCGIGEYCAIDEETPLTIPADINLKSISSSDEKKVPMAVKNKFKAHNAAVAGMKLKSRCKKMEVMSAKKRFSGATKDEIKSIESKSQCRAPAVQPVRSIVTYSNGDKKSKKVHEVSSASAETWFIGSLESRAQFCGNIYDHALQTSPFYTQIEGPAGKKPYDKDDDFSLQTDKFNMPAICTKSVRIKAQGGRRADDANAEGGEESGQGSEQGSEQESVQEREDSQSDVVQVCKTGPLARFKFGMKGSNEPVFDFVSPAIAWEGVCENGKCRVCSDFQETCTSLGIRQQCFQGAWRRYAGPAVSPDLPELLYMGGISIAIFVVEAVIMLLLCCAGGFLSTKAGSGASAATTTSTKHEQQTSGSTV